VEQWITTAGFDRDVAQSRMKIAPGQIATYREAPPKPAKPLRRCVFCEHSPRVQRATAICGGISRPATRPPARRFRICLIAAASPNELRLVDRQLMEVRHHVLERTDRDH